jgi:hypothetical protein
MSGLATVTKKMLLIFTGDWIIGIRDLPEKIEFLNNKRVRVSANIRNGNLYRKIFETNSKFNIVGGSCPTV